jgi:putative peptidoglycan lipid II flippase
VLLRTESYRRGFAYSSLLSLADNVLAFVPSMLIAAYFGTQTVTDIYYYLTGLVMLLVGFFGNIDVAVIIPEYMRLRIQNGPERAIGFLNTIWLAAGVIVVVLAAVVSVNPVKCLGLFSRFNEQVLSDHRLLLYCAVPLLPLQTMVTLLNDALHSHKFFTLPMLSSIVNRIMVIAALVLGHHRVGMMSVLLGLQLSFVVQVLCLSGLLRRSLRWKGGVDPKTLSRNTLSNMGWSALGGLATLASAYVPIFLFSGLNRGELTGLTIAQRLIGMPMAILAGQAAAVLGIKLNEEFAHKNMEAARRVFESGTALLTLVLALVAGVFFLLGRDIIVVLYQRGAFDERSTEITASLFRPIAWCLPLLGLNALIARVFMAGQRIREAFWCQVLGNVAQIATMVWAVRRWGGAGYPYAFVGFYISYLLAILPVVVFFFPELRYPATLIRCGAIGATCVLLSGVFYWAKNSVFRDFHEWQRLLVWGPTLVVATLALNSFLPFCPELTALMHEIRAAITKRLGAAFRGGDGHGV